MHKKEGLNRRERKKEKTKADIVDVALRLFKIHGFVATTMELIAQEADIAKGTLYNYFSSKEDIIDSYVKQTIKAQESEELEYLRRLPDSKTRLIAMLNSTVDWVDENRELAKIYFGFRMKHLLEILSGDNNLRSGAEGIVTEVILWGLENGELRQDISPKVLVNQVNFTRALSVLEYFNDSEKSIAKKRIIKYVDLFLYGASSNK